VSNCSRFGLLLGLHGYIYIYIWTVAHFMYSAVQELYIYLVHWFCLAFSPFTLLLCSLQELRHLEMPRHRKVHSTDELWCILVSDTIVVTQIITSSHMESLHNMNTNYKCVRSLKKTRQPAKINSLICSRNTCKLRWRWCAHIFSLCLATRIHFEVITKRCKRQSSPSA
jgi:hypothetical protein